MDHSSGVLSNQWLERLPVARDRTLARLAATIGLALLAWAVRTLADPLLPSGFPYVTFFPAVIITSFLFGVRFGALSALLCGLLAWYFFVVPLHSFQISFNVFVALAFYAFVAATDLALIHWMQTANRQLIDQRELNRELAEAKALIVRELEQRIRERDEVTAHLIDSQVQTQLATQTAGIGLWQWNVRTGEVLWDRTMFALYGLPPTPDGLVRYSDYIDSLHPDDAAQQHASLERTAANGGQSEREFRILRRDDGRICHIRAVEFARAGPDGRPLWVVGTNLDVSEQRKREAQVRMLMGEVNHRAKNMLGVVMAVAHQTGGADHDQFMARFSDRIASLAASQDLLVMSMWNGVELATLARAQLSHFEGLIGTRIRMAGPPALMSPAAVQAIGMALHELTTNASKYGALSNDAGCIEIGWARQTDGEGGDRFTITWRESGGPAVVPPTRRGFGSTVTGRMVQMSVDGQVTTDFAPGGLVWRLDCPAANIIDDGQARLFDHGARP
ncbi:MAG: HWE histidine kinase domain-containing protein [Sphingomonadales bacterium]